MKTIKLTIDGTPVEAPEGTTVLNAARQLGIKIPTACEHPDLPDYGACRLCIVEIDGVRGYPSSCTTPCAEGMNVRTRSPKLATLRNHVLELMLSGHPNACLVCPDREECESLKTSPSKAGQSTRCALCSNRSDCGIRGMAIKTNVRDLNLRTIYSTHNLERSDPFMDRDLNLCILCGRCWRICEKVHGKPAISIVKRGREASIGAAFGKSWVDSGCTFCGACIDVCPTGTLTDRFARWYGKPDREQDSTCMLCPEGCSIIEAVTEGEVVSAHMKGYDREDRLCAAGRFAYAQLHHAHNRLRQPMIKEDGELIPVPWEEALETVAGRLKEYAGQGFAVLVGEADTRETRHVYEQFARDVMQGVVGSVPANGSFEDIRPASLRDDIRAGRIRAALVAGDLLDEEAFKQIEYVVLADFLPSPRTKLASAVFPAAILAETGGTFKTAGGDVKPVSRTVDAPGEARVEWEIARDLACAMGAGGFDYSETSDVTARLNGAPAPDAPNGRPRDLLADIPVRFRGHRIINPLHSVKRATPAGAELVEPEHGFLVVDVENVVPNFFLVKVKAPVIARYAKPGQFVIMMVKETSERVPFTLIDWDPVEGTISLAVEEVGRSSREVANLRRGDVVAHMAGPLGLPYQVQEAGTVVLGGGCYGIGSIYPIARALKDAGNKVICYLEASSHYLFYYEDKLRTVCDELTFLTKDGSRGAQGGVQDAFVAYLDSGKPVDQFVAIGCTFMMKKASDLTRDRGVPLQVALNPIMVDGTGMCGACRVSVCGDTKFACVDGPLFDGHAVDWVELFNRRGAYKHEEIEAMPQNSGSGGVCQETAEV